MVIAGGVLLIVGALLIVSGQTGTVRRDRANTEENPELSVDAKLSSQIENLEADVRGLREETRVGFESLSKQISELNANGSVSSSVRGVFAGREGLTPERAAERLHHLYVDELRLSLLPPVDPRVSVRQTEALIRQAETMGPATWATADAGTWLWADLHLGHELSRSVLRPALPFGCGRRRGDDGGVVRAGRRGRDRHLPGRRQR